MIFLNLLFLIAPCCFGLTLQEVEGLLNKTKTMETEFTQMNPDETVHQGRFYLNRSTKNLKFDYQNPKGFFILAYKDWLVFYDPQAQEGTHVSIEKTPAAFLLQDKISLQSGVTVQSIHEGENHAWIQLVVQEPYTQITLQFSKHPLVFLGWEAMDAKGQLTKIIFSNPKMNQPLPAKIFDYREKFTRS